MKVYLSGGMHSGWQDRIKNDFPVPFVEFLDPRLHGLTDPSEYTKWDMTAIDSCDVVLAFLEPTNPSGVGTAFEIGYALGQGKLVYFACEKEDRYFDIVKHASSFCFDHLEDLRDVFINHCAEGLELLEA